MKRFVLLLAILLGACDRFSHHEPPANDAESVLTVDVVPVVSRKLSIIETLPAELTPYEAVAVYPRVHGFIEGIFVDRGSVVRRGELLARLSAPELIAQRAEAQSRMEGDRSTFERLRSASHTPGAVARHELELAQAALQADQGRVQSLKTLANYLLVYAPFDGIVTERNVHTGALVGPPTGPNTTPMLRIEEVTHLRLTVAVPEADVGAIAEGAAADFHVRAWPGRNFSGIIRRVSHSVDIRTRTMPVELDVDNGKGLLAPGMFAEVQWPVRRDTPSLFVPSFAVVQTTERTFVDCVHMGRVQQVPVQRGATMGDLVEVSGPLKESDLVLAHGSEEMPGESRVIARVAKSPASAR